MRYSQGYIEGLAAFASVYTAIIVTCILIGVAIIAHRQRP
jgi:hypothetical protein